MGMSPCTGEPLVVMAELLEVFTTLNEERDFQMDGIRAISADNDIELVVQVKGLVSMSRR